MDGDGVMKEIAISYFISLRGFEENAFSIGMKGTVMYVVVTGIDRWDTSSTASHAFTEKQFQE